MLASLLLPVVALASTVFAVPAGPSHALAERDGCINIFGIEIGDCGHDDQDFCLDDNKAKAIYTQFASILTNPDRQGANKTAQALIATNYQEVSDSINSLAGFPLGSVTFNGKTAFVNGVVTAQAIPSISTLLSFHDCTHVAWHWVVNGLGANVAEVKGTNLFTVNSKLQIIDDQIEFNSIAWGADTGYTTLFPGQQCPANLCPAK